MKCIVVCLSLLFSLNLLAAKPSAEGFFKRFNLIKQDGKLVAIADRSIDLDFSIRTFITRIKNDLLQEQKKMREQKGYMADARQMILSDWKLREGERESELPEYMVASLEEIKKLNVEQIFANDGFNEVINGFSDKLKSLMLQLRLDLVASPEDMDYFYYRNVGYQAVKWGLDFAKKRLSQVMFLNVASYVIVKVENLVRERRTYHQNMLLYYLNNFSETELGMTKEEADKVFSSIYESRIAWYNIFESRQAKENWQVFGTNKFYASFRAATNKLRSNKDRYDSVGNRLNFAFNDVVYKGKRIIVNLFDNESIVQWYPSVAYEYDSPNKITRKRQIYRLVQIGISFVPIPDFFKSLVNTYVDSTFVEHRQTEGALYGYFESIGDREMQATLIRQTINPFEAVDYIE